MNMYIGGREVPNGGGFFFWAVWLIPICLYCFTVEYSVHLTHRLGNEQRKMVEKDIKRNLHITVLSVQGWWDLAREICWSNKA